MAHFDATDTLYRGWAAAQDDAARRLGTELDVTNMALLRYLERLTERVEYLEAKVVELQDREARR